MIYTASVHRQIQTAFGFEHLLICLRGVDQPVCLVAGRDHRRVEPLGRYRTVRELALCASGQIAVLDHSGAGLFAAFEVIGMEPVPWDVELPVRELLQRFDPLFPVNNPVREVVSFDVPDRSALVWGRSCRSRRGRLW